MEYIIFEELPAKSGKLGVVTLTRCKALNALNFEMIQALQLQLRPWADDVTIFAVVLQSACERAFCAGGDIRAIYEERHHLAQQLDFFKHEYPLNYLIGTYPKPIVALLKGIVMGGGAGLSIHASHRVACETLIFSMPETAIGLFPDVGSSYFLNKMPGFLGRYCGLSSARLNVADAVYAGVVDYTISSNHHADVIVALTEAELTIATAHSVITEILQSMSVVADQSIYQAKQDFIDGIFCADQVSTILDFLRHDQAEWSQAVVAHLHQKSPTSLVITLEALRRSKGKDLAFCLQQDFILLQSFLISNDLYEGIRAITIDKDMSPIWCPDTLAAIDDNQINRYFSVDEKESLTLL